MSHDELAFALMEAGRRVRAAADDPKRFPAARDDLVRFCLAELLPHLESDESWLLEARHCAEAHLLSDAIRTEARAMAAAVDELLAAATGPYEAVAATRLLHALWAAHAHHEEMLTTAIGPDCGFITGSNLLIEDGVTAAHGYGELAPDQHPSSDG